MTRFLRLFFLGLFALLSLAAQAQPFPSKPLKIIVPAAPGGTTDIASRLVAKRMAEVMGQPVVVENKAGGGGIIGSQALKQSAPDGYTLIMGNIGPNAINFGLYKQLPYRAEDFAPITLVVSVPNVLVVHPDVPAKSVKELVALAKSQPGKLSFASSGTGQSVHLSGEMFKLKTGTDIIHVPYKGAGPAVADLMAGQVTMMIDNLPSSLPHIQAGKLRALAVTSKDRVAELPDVPSLRELGFEDFQVTAWFGLMAPGGTPQPIIDQLYKTISSILSEPDIRKRLTELGGTPGGQPPAQFTSFIAEERVRWMQLIKATGLPQLSL
jgi:tripartite-type tricarboxylate transporter receptor subunit TctC